MAKMNMLHAINSALDITMAEHPNACIFGEDVGYFGGVFRATSGLQEKYGKHRVFNTPLTEQGILGFANGLAAFGAPALAEIQFADYIFPAFDQITNETAKFRYRSGNQFNVGGLIIRTPYGGGIKGGIYHSQSPEAYFTHTAGLVIVAPSNAYEAKGLLCSAIYENNPVIFFEPKRLYRSSKNKIPQARYTIPIGKANIISKGTDITLIAWGAQVEVIQQAAIAVQQQNINCEVIDLRTLAPWDKDTIIQSACKTGRVIINQEAPKTSGFAGEIAATIQEKCFLYLKAPVTRLCGLDTPFPYSQEQHYLPSVAKTINKIKQIIEY